MNKAIPIIMMLCATMILMAHAMVPHHHHDNVACFISPVEEHEHHCCEHDSDQAEKPPAHKDNEVCVLSDMLAIVPHTFKQENFDVENAVNDINAQFLTFLISPSEENAYSAIPSEAFRIKPFPDSSYEQYIGRSLGMRGPPSC